MVNKNYDKYIIICIIILIGAIFIFKDLTILLYLNDKFYNIYGLGIIINNIYSNKIYNYCINLCLIENENLTSSGLNFLISYKQFILTLLSIFIGYLSIKAHNKA